MNQFDLIFNATLNSNHTIDVHVHKKYSTSFTKKFYLYCDDERICELVIQDRRETNNHFHYVLSGVPALTIGSEYKIYDDRYLYCNLDMNVLLKNEKICSLYYTDEEMGAIYEPSQTTFRIFSPLASAAYIVYEKDGIETITAMVKNFDNGVFSATIKGNLAKCKYHFLVRINGVLEAANDPYAKSLTVQSSKGIIVDPKEVEVNLHNDCLKDFYHPTEAIIYEMSVRDMTSMIGTSICYKGKFLGLTEKSCLSINNNSIGIDYIKQLGITHVQLLPIFDFCTVNEENQDETYNWGYDPLYWNSPEGSYSSNPRDPYARIIELKKMIATFHKSGIRVVMDVVFNHVFNLEQSCFEKLCPSYYFRYKSDGSPSNGSFCGNEFNSSHPMAKKFIIDSCLYWVKEFGIDGFRFDLMGLIDCDTINEVKEECQKLKPGFLVYGEGWDMPTVLSSDKMAKMANSFKMPGVSFFNDRYRDIIKGKSGDMELYVKGYLLGDINYRDGFKHCFLGSCLPLAYPPLFNNPSQSINYIECHDNATLFDKLLIANGHESEQDRLKRINLMNGVLLLSFGVPFIHAGQEIGMGKKGVYNSYNAGDDINHFDYHLMDQRMTMVSYIKDLIKIRKTYDCFKIFDKDLIAKIVTIKDLDEGATLVEYRNLPQLDNKSLYLIINPNNHPIFHEFENYLLVIANENGLLNEGIHVRGLQASPISLTIAIDD